ncbi:MULTISPECIES: hypothetical protein [Streptomyces]|uniref:Secreted protein n=1 Tax=Streptomyces eurythermus TaxID=42237 RepID=A0ABW6YMI9_9ACTN|nr:MULTISPECIES: hypothetical protein [Streptomyces]QIS71438.1 hypothetical protein HB370_16635 [Streptomyces sp. DSM 40868]
MADSLLVAAVSVLGTLAGGGLTAAVTFRSERRKDAALAEQQRMQLLSAEQQQVRLLQAEERRQIRELQIDHRRQVYQQFLADAHAVNHDGDKLGDMIMRSRYEAVGDIDALAAEVDAAVRAAGGSVHKVQLEGPEPVSQLADELMLCLSQLPPTLSTLRRWRQDGSRAEPGEETPVDSWFQAHSRLNDCLDAFVTAARSAMDDLLRVSGPDR